mgnify:CR=1 FL=1
MKKMKNAVYSATICACLSLLAACGGGGDGDTSTPIQAPTASIAPVNAVALGASVNLDGRSSLGPNGGELTYQWGLIAVPAGSVAVIADPKVSQTAFLPDKAGVYEIRLTVTSSGGLSASATARFDVQPVSAIIDRTRTQWLISESTSSLDGVKTTKMLAPGLGGSNFVITCNSKGERAYYIETDFVTGSGAISYRVGHYPVATELWSESQSSGFRRLFPARFDTELLKKFYKSNEFILDVSKYTTGVVRSEPRMVGFPAAIDKTRASCGWSEQDFPPNNGWSAELPDVAALTAKKPTYLSGTSPAGSAFNGQFGFVAWVAINSGNKPQLLVRVGEDKSLCKGSDVVSDYSFYVEQAGRRVEASPGFDFSLKCSTNPPATLALQGDFDPSLPFVLKAYLFHFTTLTPGLPFAEVTF